MKNYLFTLLCLVASFTAFSQSPLSIGETQVNFGLGFDDIDGLPIYGSLDFGVAENITVAPTLGFSGSYLSLGGNANFHFDDIIVLPPEWNLYAGLNVGFFFGDNDADGFGLGAQVGGRYFFTETLGANIEFGGGSQVSGGKLGATLKF